MAVRQAFPPPLCEPIVGARLVPSGTPAQAEPSALGTMPTPSWGKGVEMSRVIGGLFLAALLLAFLLSPPAAKANTFVFNDLSDTVTASGPGGSSVPCAAPLVPEQCQFDISPPVGTKEESAFGIIDISDPGGITVSDEVTSIFNISTGGITVAFQSDSSESPLGLCVATLTGGCQLTETGDVQMAGTLTWSGGAGCPPTCTTLRTDTIEFASDTTEVPEPASWLLVLTGLPLLGRRRLRRPRWVS